MSANPAANGGLLLRELSLPDFRDYAVESRGRGNRGGGDARARRLAEGRDGGEPVDFRLFGPDETESNRLHGLRGHRQAVRDWPIVPGDNHLAPSGRVMEVLSEHLCEGWLEGYLLTGRHGLFDSYEAFIHIVDSMFNQHAKWLKVTAASPGGGRWPR